MFDSKNGTLCSGKCSLVVLPWFGLSLLIIFLDQIAKYWVNHRLFYGETVPIIPGFFNFTLLYNPGAAFSLLADAGGWQTPVFTVLAFFVTGWLSWQILRGHFGRLMNCAAACIIGGALGNVIDRIVYGYVIDFIQFFYRTWYYPAFNLADAFICIGAVLIVLDSLKGNNRKQND